MISKMMKLIYILICVFVFVACDEDDHVSGEVNLKCEKNVNSDPNCYGLETHSMPLDDLDDYVSEVHGDGDVVTYHWAEGLAWFLESKNMGLIWIRMLCIQRMLLLVDVMCTCL